jgi:hypothetical protein
MILPGGESVLKLRSILVMAAVAAILVASAGCAITQNSDGFIGSDIGGASDDAVVPAPSEDETENPFSEPVVVAEDSDDDTVAPVNEGDDDSADADPDDEVALDPVEIIPQGLEEGGAVTVTVGQQYQSGLIVVTGGSGEGFGWSSNLPDGLELESINTTSSRVRVTGTPDIADLGDHDVTLTVADTAGEGASASLSFKLSVMFPFIEPGNIEPLPDPCAEPLEIKLTSFTNGDGGEHDVSQSQWAVDLGSEGTVAFEVVGGKPPFTWTWTSRMRESLQCWRKIHFFPGHYYYDFVDEGDECRGDDYSEVPMYAQNMTWEPAGVERELLNAVISDENFEEPRAFKAETQGRKITLDGRFKYSVSEDRRAALPVDSDGEDYHSVPLRDEFRVTVTDACERRAEPAVKEMDFNVFHKREKLADAEITLKYKSADTSNKKTWTADEDHCHMDKCSQFERANIGFFFVGDADAVSDNDIEIGDDADGENNGKLLIGEGSDSAAVSPSNLKDLFEVADAYAVFKMTSLKDGDGRLTRGVRHINDLATVSDARALILRLDTPSKKTDGFLWVDETDYDNLNIIEIKVETKQWVMEMDITDARDPWAYKKTRLYDYPKFFMVAPDLSGDLGLHVVKNSEGGLFRRKALVDYD